MDRYKMASAFKAEIIKREINACGDLEQLKQLTVMLVDLLEGQKQWLRDQFGSDPSSC